MATIKISISDLSYFSACRRQWFWGQKYTPKVPIPAYFLGTVVHEGLEVYYKTKDPDRVSAAMTKIIDQTLTAVSENSIEFGGDEANQEYEDLAQQARGMIENYLKYDAENPFLGTIQEIESSIRIPIPLENSEDSILLSGRIDLILSDSLNRLWVIDHKTSSTYSKGLPGLDVDEQLTGYMYLLWKKTGIMPEGVVYNVLLKKVPGEPRVLKSGELSKDKSQATTYGLYMAALEAMNLDPYKYDDFLEYLKDRGWDDYFFREVGWRNAHELLSFENRVKVKASEIAAIYRDPERYAYPSPSTYSCNYCQYLSACKSKEDGGDAISILESRFNVRQSN